MSRYTLDAGSLAGMLNDMPVSTSETQNTFVVLGMHRSGTSLVAGILNALGVRMGPKGASDAWIHPHWSNPTGLYENPDFLRFDSRALGLNQRGVHLPAGWERSLHSISQVEAKKVVSISEGGFWGWKSPWTVLTIPLYLPYLTNPRFVVVERDPAEVAKSLRDRDSADMEENLKVANLFRDHLRTLVAKHPDIPTLTLEFREVVGNPAMTVSRLNEFAGTRSPPEIVRRAIGLVLPDANKQEVKRHLAQRELATFPRYCAGILMTEVRGWRIPSSLTADIWLEFLTTFKAAVKR